jgi:hypothetical protein
MAKYKVEDSDFPGIYQVFQMQWYLKRVSAVLEDHKQIMTVRVIQNFRARVLPINNRRL